MAELIRKPGPDFTALLQYASPEFRSAYVMAALMAASGQFKDVNDASKAMARILLGGELGLAPAASLILIDFVQGKPRLSGAACAALIKRSKDYTYHIKKWDEQLCEIEFFVKNTDGTKGERLGVSSFSMEEAKEAKLTSNPTYQKFPKNMLFNRAITNGFRTFTPDLGGGVAGRIYGPGELPGDNVTDADMELPEEVLVKDAEPKALPPPDPSAKAVLGKVAAVAPAVAELLAERNKPIEGHVTSPEVKAEVKLAATASAAGIKPGDHPQLAPEPLTDAEVEEFPEDMRGRVKALAAGASMANDDLKTLFNNARDSLGSAEKVRAVWEGLGVVPKPGVAVPVRTALQFMRNVKKQTESK